MLLNTSLSIQISSMECDHEQNMGMAVVLWFLYPDTGRKTGWVSDSTHKGHTTPAPVVVSQELALCPLNSRHIKSFHVVWTEILTVQEDSTSPENSEQITWKNIIDFFTDVLVLKRL